MKSQRKILTRYKFSRALTEDELQLLVLLIGCVKGTTVNPGLHECVCRGVEIQDFQLELQRMKSEPLFVRAIS